MTVYVESNFVLELALLQEQYASCDTIVSLAERKSILLVIPAYSMVEPYETLIRNERRRQKIADQVRTELGQLSRSEMYSEKSRELTELTALLIRSGEEERTHLSAVVERLQSAASVIPPTSSVIAESMRQQDTFSPQDAILYSSVVSHLSRDTERHRLFLNRNSKDFDDPNVQENLEGLGCKMIFRFNDGLDYINSRLTD